MLTPQYLSYWAITWARVFLHITFPYFLTVLQKHIFSFNIKPINLYICLGAQQLAHTCSGPQRVSVSWTALQTIKSSSKWASRNVKADKCCNQTCFKNATFQICIRKVSLSYTTISVWLKAENFILSVKSETTESPVQRVQGSLSSGWNGQDVKLTIHPHLMPMIRIFRSTSAVHCQ
jgi:hypothetical protein